LKFLWYLLAGILPKSKQREEEENERRRRQDPSGLRTWFLGILLLVLIGGGLYSWMTGTDIHLDARKLLSISAVTGLLVGLIAIITAFAKFFGSESSDDAPRALQGNTGCAVFILVVVSLIGLMVLISRMRDNARAASAAEAREALAQPGETPDAEPAPPEN
jgi:hypothetical protein